MLINQLAGVIAGDAARIASAIPSGAAWEIWMQVELYILVKGQGMQAARETPYPAPNQAKKLDLIAKDAQGVYAIELKVESATNAGTALLNSVIADATKLRTYYVPAPAPGARWAVGISYGDQARNAMQQYASQANNHAYFVAANFPDSGSMGVMIIDV